ncbi:Rrf2 family transcriptional regulator OS=Streptomyces antimycoticus OX=68175 GN=SANT12839_006810 PE=4 SV=1 [Streptomyces antimycoticus]
MFQDLRQAGLVRSQRGCEGGYWLARDPAEVTLADIVLAVDRAFLTLRGERLDDLGYHGPGPDCPGCGAGWRTMCARC